MERQPLLRPAVVLFAALTLLAGGAYPLVVTVAGQALFPLQAGGSLVLEDGKPVGSSLVGQNFNAAIHFWGRPSATAPQPYNGLASGGSNLGPLNPALVDTVKARIASLQAADPGNADPVPVDLVTASASGLDPDISPAAARYQVARVAKARGLPAAMVAELVEGAIDVPQPGFLGEARVNVLRLNLALDSLRP